MIERKNMTKSFTLGQILSITTGRLMCDISGIYKILNFMTKDNLYTHQLGKAAEECKPYLLRQHPQLENILLKNVTRENWLKILGRLTDLYGEKLDVEPIPMDDHDKINPLQELEDMTGKNTVIIVKIDVEEDVQEGYEGVKKC